MLKFILGAMIGGLFGIVTMCLFITAKEADIRIEELDK